MTDKSTPDKDTQEQKCTGQTYKTKEKIEEMIGIAHAKLNYGSSNEKLMAVGIIQLINELSILSRQCPNNYELGKSIRELFGIKNKL